MIYLLEIENFYSIRDLQVIDLIASRSATPSSDRLIPVGKGLEERVPRVVSFFGPNAAGKSNSLKALSFLAWFVSHSFLASPGNYLPFSRFLHKDYGHRPSRLALGFSGPGDPANIAEKKNANVDLPDAKYHYEVVLGGEHLQPQVVLSEVLKYWPVNTNRPVTLFQRDESGLVKAGKTFGLKGYQSSLEKVLRKNASVVSTLAQLQHPISIGLQTAAQGIVSNILTERAEFEESQVTQLYLQDPELLSALNRQIERIDFGIRDLKFVESIHGMQAMVSHLGLTDPLILSYESHGTRQFIKTFPIIFHALATGGVAVIDELDISIHPLVLPEILNWFNDPKRNSKNAQLWLTAQNPSLLEDLTKDEIFFCEKGRNGATKIYGLRDIQSVRRTDNFYRKYLSGVYGAVPLLE